MEMSDPMHAGESHEGGAQGRLENGCGVNGKRPEGADSEMVDAGVGEQEARKRKHRALDPSDASTRWMWLQNKKKSIKTMLSTLHDKGGVEWYLVTYDRMNYKVTAENSPGLQLWAETVKAAEKAPIAYECQEDTKRMQEALKRTFPKYQPLEFKNIPGGERVQRRVVRLLCQMALPDRGSPAFLARTTTAELRGMFQPSTGRSYESWPEDLPLLDIKDMTLPDMERVAKWALRFEGSHDTRGLVDRLTDKRVFRCDATESLTQDGHRELALRLVQAAIGEGTQKGMSKHTPGSRAAMCSPDCPPPPPPHSLAKHTHSLARSLTPHLATPSPLLDQSKQPDQKQLCNDHGATVTPEMLVGLLHGANGSKIMDLMLLTKEGTLTAHNCTLIAEM